MEQDAITRNNSPSSPGDKWKYCAFYDKSMKLATLILQAMENILKITSNLDVAVVRGGGGIAFFKMAASQILCFDNMKQNDVLQCQMVILVIQTY